MPKITFPPTGMGHRERRECCLEYGGPLSVEFTQEGYFSHDDNTAFYPEFPTGVFPAGTIGPYPASNSDHEVTLSFYTGGVVCPFVSEIKQTCRENKCP